MVARFLDYIMVERRYSRLTAAAYERDLKEFADFLSVETEALEPLRVTEGDVKEWMIEMLDKGSSPRSVRRKLSSLRSFWKYLLRIGYTDIDITQRIILPKTDRPLPVFYKENEMTQACRIGEYADDFPSVRNSLIIEMLYQTGMRQAEMLSIRDGDIDYATGSIRVFGKRRKERVIPLGSGLLEQIALYRQWRDKEWGEGGGERPFFLNDKGRPLTKGALYGIVRTRMSEVSTLKKQSPHVLRHTFATAMLNNGADINTIKELMGHANLAATQIYTHTTFDQIKQVYRDSHPRAKRD